MSPPSLSRTSFCEKDESNHLAESLRDCRKWKATIAMNSKDWALEMALYSKWQNEVLYGLCDALPDRDRKYDRGMFFTSIHNTLDHTLILDVLLRNFIVTGQPPEAFEPGKLVYTDYRDLSRQRRAFDTALLDLLGSQADSWLDETITFESERLKRCRTVPRMFFCMQMFNHGTHHRSQVTAELHKMGIDYGCTDLPYNPHSQYQRY